MANWLNITFFNLDKQIFVAMNGLERLAGNFLTPFLKFISFFGEAGIFLIVLSLFLMLFKSFRRTGFAMLLSIGIGALFTNVILKNAVARPRPFYADQQYSQFWIDAGRTMVSEYSFPSGHTTVAMTSMTALFLSTNKKISWTAYIFVILTAFSRVYLIVHYFSDIMGGLIVGGLAGTAGYFLAKYIFKIIERNAEKKFCKFLLSADIINLIKSDKNKGE